MTTATGKHDDEIFATGFRPFATLAAPAISSHAASVLPTDAAYASGSGSLFSQQWYLSNTGQSGAKPGLDLGVASVWKDYTGKGVNVAVFDDGIDVTNKEFAGRVSIDGTSTSGGLHGSAVTGIIGAANDGVGTVGIAYDAKLTGVDIMQGGSSLFDAMWTQSSYDVVNHSWGFTGAFADNPLNAGWQYAFFAANADAADYGRNGLGTLMFAASGNGRAAGDSAEVHGFTVDRHVAAIGAVTDQGYVAYYSNGGANLLVSGLSNGGANGVATTDRTGSAGYSTGDYTSGFGGTSASTPEASGIGALMLEANGALGWRDVQSIMAASANHAGSDIGAGTRYAEKDAWSVNGSATWNGGGMHFSNDYGFGVMDAHAATRLAETWLVGADAQTSANEVQTSASLGTGSYTLKDAGTTEYSFTLAAGIDVEHMVLDLVGLKHADAGQLTVELVSPDGTVSQLLQNNASGSAVSGGWELMSNEFRGEDSAGTWTVRIVDGTAGKIGTLTDVQLTAYGALHTNDTRFVYTDEFGAMGGLSRSVLTDYDGGIDTINASAVTKNTTFDLAVGGVVAGRAVGIGAGTIENFVAGDGDDRIYGNSADNHLLGGRGNDVLDGRGGNNWLEGGAGDDLLYAGGGGVDRLDGGAGFDTASWANALRGMTVDMTDQGRNAGSAAGDQLTSIERIVGSVFADEIHAGNGAVQIEAGSGNDVIYGEGVDGAKLFGETGNDRIVGGAGGQYIDGGAGTDTVAFDTATSGVTVDFGNSLNNTGDAAGDVYANVEAVEGSRFDDVIRLAGNVRVADGGAGNDVIQGSSQSDMIKGGDGSDWIEGGGGADVLDGGAGVDWLSYLNSPAGVRIDMVLGTASGGDAQGDRFSNFENVTGSRFNDVIFGDKGNNVLEGNAGDDELRGGAGNDTLRGGDGNDRLFGDDGSDFLIGGAGTNQLTGGAGADLFQVSKIGMQMVMDFTRGQGDKIYLQASEFGSILGDRKLGADDFASGTKVDFTGRHEGFYFENNSSTLWYDQDGAGGHAAQAIAKIVNVSDLKATDFVIA